MAAAEKLDLRIIDVDQAKIDHALSSADEIIALQQLDDETIHRGLFVENILIEHAGRVYESQGFNAAQPFFEKASRLRQRLGLYKGLGRRLDIYHVETLKDPLVDSIRDGFAVKSLVAAALTTTKDRMEMFRTNGLYLGLQLPQGVRINHLKSKTVRPLVANFFQDAHKFLQQRTRGELRPAIWVSELQKNLYTRDFRLDENGLALLTTFKTSRIAHLSDTFVQMPNPQEPLYAGDRKVFFENPDGIRKGVSDSIGEILGYVRTTLRERG